MPRSLLALLLAGTLVAVTLQAEPQICVYTNAKGGVEQTNDLNQIPARFKSTAKCFTPKQISGKMEKPAEIALKGNVREEHMGSSLGPINLRWPRKVEVLFGRTPQRAVAEAATAVSRALKHGGFSVELQRLSLPWEIVFMDEELPEKQIPAYLVSNCHPAWMTPPANIYVVGQRVVAGCGDKTRPSTSVADGQLAQVLIHEMGHAVEYQLLQGKATQERMLAEGFACWFEQYASDFAAVLSKGQVERQYMTWAKEALRQAPFGGAFSPTAHEYAKASLLFHALVNRGGISRLSDVYGRMAEERLDFYAAVKRTLGWDLAKLYAEAARF